MLHFKKELSRHVVKLQELSNSGDPHAQKRLKNVRTKLAQLDKIVPYLGKYISVNRQAEMQTIAVLKESCTVELQKLSQGKTVSKSTSESISEQASTQVDGNLVSLPVPHEQPAKENMTAQGIPPPENPYASLSELRKDTSNTVKLRTNYAELDFHKIRGSENIRPPSVKYSEVRIDSMGIGRVLPDQTPAKSDVVAKLLSEAAKEPMTPEIDSAAVEYDSSLHDVTITPENVTDSLEVAVDGQAHSATPATTNRQDELISADHTSDILQQDLSPPPPPKRVDSISADRSKNKSPPPVSRKPASRQSLTSNQQTKDMDQADDSQMISGNEKVTSSTPLQGVPSVMQRIKVYY